MNEEQKPAPVEAAPDLDSNFDEVDVPAALERETDDGPGFDSEDELPDEDFESFAEGDVETEDVK